MDTASTLNNSVTPKVCRPSTCTADPARAQVKDARTWFNHDVHRAVLFDQPAAGLSTPHASQADVDWSSIDMAHHIADIERIRTELGIERWLILGISWGSVLGLAYAQAHADRVSGLVLGAVSTGSAAEIDWMTQGVAEYFPAEWQRFADHVPADMRAMRIVDAYNDLVMDPSPRSTNLPPRPGADGKTLTSPQRRPQAEPALQRSGLQARLRPPSDALLPQQQLASSRSASRRHERTR